MPRSLSPTLTDYAVTAISPALIMAMVGSLVFFLIEVLYAGKYSDRLLWTMAFFVIGTVLIARILILHGANRALIYAAGLAAATFLALQAFVDYPNLTMRSFSAFINAALMALIWWSANKLTWDCTHINEGRRNAGRGVLDAAAGGEDDEPPAKPQRPDPPGLLGWLSRIQRHHAAQAAKPHTPGVWVLYFSLASLPLFGLGQSLIPTADTERRRTVFLLITAYVASGLGLLATTTLLGLRKYLRDRGATIPGKMTAGWLGLAAVMIAVFLAVAAVLPRPHSETPLIKLPKFADSKKRDANSRSVLKDRSKGEREGDTGNEQKHDPNAAQTKDGKDGSPNRDDSDAERAKGNESSETKDSQQKGEQQKGESESKKNDRENANQKKSPDGQPQSANAQMDPPKLGSIVEKAGTILKWIAWAVVAMMVLAAIIIFILRFLAPFTSWAKGLLDWISSLFRKHPEREVAAPQINVLPTLLRPPPFSSFADPTARRISAVEMVTYSFTALEAWAWERNLPRSEGETPLEFAARLQCETGLDPQPLARLYSQALYSTAALAETAPATVRAFWQTHRAAAGSR